MRDADPHCPLCSGDGVIWRGPGHRNEVCPCVPPSYVRDLSAEKANRTKTPEEWENHYRIMGSRPTPEQARQIPAYVSEDRLAAYLRSRGELTHCCAQRLCACGRYERMINGRIEIIKGRRERRTYWTWE